MDTRQLGPLTTSAVGLGCMGFSQAYGPADDDESVAAIRTALDSGITLLDTAMSYGSGHNEELVGRAVAGRRDDVLLATKFGIVRTADGTHVDARPLRVPEFCDGLAAAPRRRCHRPVLPAPDRPVRAGGGHRRRDGRTGLGGQGAASRTVRGHPAQLAQAAAVHPIAAVELEWSLSWREPEDDVVPAARELGIGLVPYSPLGRGLLTGALPSLAADDFRAGDPRFAGSALSANIALVQALSRIAAARGVTVGQLALAWLLAQGPDVVPIPGSRRPSRIASNAAAASIALTADDLAALEAAAPRGRGRAIGGRSPRTGSLEELETGCTGRSELSTIDDDDCSGSPCQAGTGTPRRR